MSGYLTAEFAELARNLEIGRGLNGNALLDRLARFLSAVVRVFVELVDARHERGELLIHALAELLDSSLTTADATGEQRPYCYEQGRNRCPGPFDSGLPDRLIGLDGHFTSLQGVAWPMRARGSCRYQ
jgi:hypothetical protein